MRLPFFVRDTAKRALGPILASLVMAAMTAVMPAYAAEPIKVELNKLEPTGQGGASCRAYFVASNPEAPAIPALRLDLVVFASDGVIASRVALDLGPLAPRRTVVRLFDVTNLPCDKIGQFLINDVIACSIEGSDATADQQRGICLDRLTPSARGTQTFLK
jgi:hypothetical protein